MSMEMPSDNYLFTGVSNTGEVSLLYYMAREGAYMTGNRPYRFGIVSIIGMF